jgi:hypothetical protein
VSGRLSQRRIRRRLVRVHAELVAKRAQIGVLGEQLAAFADDAEEARVRSIVTENTADVRSSRHAEGHRMLTERALAQAHRRIAELEVLERELLDQVQV